MSRTAIPFPDVRAIERAIEQLDDGAFAALLHWFDGYANRRWQGRGALPNPAAGVADALRHAAERPAVYTIDGTPPR